MSNFDEKGMDQELDWEDEVENASSFVDIILIQSSSTKRIIVFRTATRKCLDTFRMQKCLV